MSHVSSHRARVTDHAVRRFAERVLHRTVPAGLTDRQAVGALLAQGVDVADAQARLAAWGGIVLAARQVTGTVLVPEEGMRVRVADGVVVTVLTPPPRVRPARHLMAMERAA
ncbi:hypothetical protein ASF49_08165 [Methylobacterium sp. Leaf104]|uniref:hypothetical protein n=1 Tax=Methylobacterium TaxID=407 RepID=UPI0006FEA829|nr:MULTISPECIES: hypothetical protein [Methylobacterium]KQP33832.1 hypothetical protein ASF49_08165 [Methylobacterium sp. Leaf104]MCI9879600.1 hypothetical protein [Methylobacterium goesingense]